MKSFGFAQYLDLIRVYTELTIPMKHKVNAEHPLLLSDFTFIEICHVLSGPNPKLY